MAFDLISFLAGVAAGALTGGLAGLLHSLERTAGIQEKLRVATQKLDQLSGGAHGSPVPSSEKVDDLQRELDEIHEEIKRMYRRTTR